MMDCRKSTLCVLLLFLITLAQAMGSGAQELPEEQESSQTYPATNRGPDLPTEIPLESNEFPDDKVIPDIPVSSESTQINPDDAEHAGKDEKWASPFTYGLDESAGGELRESAATRRKAAAGEPSASLQSEPSDSKKSAPKTSSTKKSVGKWVKKNGWRVALIVVFAVMALFATNSFSKFLLDSFTRDREGTEIKKRARTLSSVVRYILMGVIALIAGLMILKELDLDIGPILAGASVVGIAIGFGAQDLVKDIIAGFFILMEDQIRVGDVITVADKTGYVEKVTLRMVVLRDVAGNVHYVPSGEITMVTNKTKVYSRYLFEISVAYKEDIDEVIALMKDVDEDMRADSVYSELILEPLEVMGLDRFDSSGMIIKARTKTKPNKQWKVGREFNRRFKKKFDEEGIEIPFPHLTIYPGESKTGKAPPFRVEWQKMQSESVDAEK